MDTKWRVLILLTCIVMGPLGCVQRPDDAALADSIKGRLFSDATLKEEPIGITVTNAEATLIGGISSSEARRRVVSLAQAVPGVVKVHDAMRLTQERAAGAIPMNGVVAVSMAAFAGPLGPVSQIATEPVANSPAQAEAAQETSKSSEPRTVVIPQGTNIRVVIIDPIDSEKSKVGSSFLASLDAPITVGNEVVVPKNVNVFVRLTDASSSGKFKGKSELHLALDYMEFQSKRYLLQSSTYVEAGKSQGKETAKKVGIGAVVGTTIGAVAGGGKGAAIGAGVGGGAGLATQALMHGNRVRIPAETKLDFTLEEPIEITIQPGKNVPPN